MLLLNIMTERCLDVTAAWLAAQLADRTMRGIASGVGALIHAGTIPVGTQLPPVRELAQAMGISPATVSAAWSELRHYRVISGRGRTGTWVSGDAMMLRPHRFSDMGNFGPGAIDLTLAVPDTALLPPIKAALAYGAEVAELNSYQRQPIIADLRRAVAPGWAYPAEAYLATNGGYDAMNTAVQALIRPGSVVAIEEPTAIRLLDILDHMKAQIIPIGSDVDGPDLVALAAALKKQPAAFIFQPRTHSVTGGSVSARRMRALAKMLTGTDMLVIEDDGIGDISSHAALSVGMSLPRQTIHIRSYSKSLGPDLRVAVLSGSDDLVNRIQAFRSFGVGWTSRILQAAVAWLIRDPATDEVVKHARSVYKDRRNALIDALRARGTALPCYNGDGMALWMPVRSEQFAIITLAARRIAVAPGGKFQAAPSGHIRIATSRLTTDLDTVADALSLVRRDAGIGFRNHCEY